MAQEVLLGSGKSYFLTGYEMCNCKCVENVSRGDRSTPTAALELAT